MNEFNPTWIVAAIAVAAILVNIGTQKAALGKLEKSQEGMDERLEERIEAAFGKLEKSQEKMDERMDKASATSQEQLVRLVELLASSRENSRDIDELKKGSLTFVSHDARLVALEAELRGIREWKHDVVAKMLQEHAFRIHEIERQRGGTAAGPI